MTKVQVAKSVFWAAVSIGIIIRDLSTAVALAGDLKNSAVRIKNNLN